MILQNVTEHSLFYKFYNFLILTNAIILSLEGISDQQILDKTQHILLLFYVLEFLMKISIYKLNKYFKDQINVIDFMALLYLIYYFLNDVFSIIEKFEGEAPSDSFTVEGFKYLRFFRILLILKIFRLFSYFDYMQFIKAGIRRTFSRFIYNALLLLLLMIIYAGYGFQMYQNDINAFQTYSYSIMSVLQIITMDNWYVMFAECYGKTDRLFSVIFFLSLILLGNYIFLNLFIALVLDGFETISKENSQDLTNSGTANNGEIEDYDNSSSDDEEEIIQIEDYKAVESRDFGDFMQKFKFDVDYEAKVKKRKLPFLDKSKYMNRRTTNNNRLTERSKTILTDKDLNLHLLKTMQLKLGQLEVQYKALKEKYSLFIFSKKSSFRRNCFFITKSPCFSGFINIVIIMNTIKFGMDTWIDWQHEENDKFLKDFTVKCDFIFFAVFSLEAGLKSVADGVIISKDSYLRNPFNFMNFLNILGVIVSYFVSDQTLNIFKVYIKVALI